ncbi:MAG: TIGR01777 family oxidoreductase [Chloroflexia bacterium]|nr:TIGR01777 family oxidoreductase [Chloroflexia bacterium]
MRVVIAGGTGLIGRALSASLSRDGHEVIVLSRSPERHSPYATEAVGGPLQLPAGVRAAYWTGQSTGDWAHLLENAEAVVNLAGENIAGSGLIPKRWTARRKQRILQSRLDAGRALVEAFDLAAQKPAVLVQASGVGIYGPRGDEEIDEEAPSGPADDFLSKTGRRWESSTTAVEEMGVRRAIIRSGGVLSTAGGVLPRLLLIVRSFVGGPTGSGRQYLPWIHVSDEVRAIRFLIEEPQARGPFNLAAPESVTNRQFMRLLGRVLRRPTFLPTPAFALKVAFGELATLLLDGQRAVPKKLLDLGFEFRFPELEPALRDLME